MGQRIAARSTPEQLRDGVLTLRVASAVWSQELSLLSTDIIARLAELGFSVERIRCRVGEVEPKPKPRPRKTAAPAQPNVPLPKALLEQLELIGDEELRNVVATAAQSQLNLLHYRAMQRSPRSAHSPEIASEGTRGVQVPRFAESKSAPPGQIGPGQREAPPRTRERRQD